MSPATSTSGETIALLMPNPRDDGSIENEAANLDFGPAPRHAEDHDTTNIVFREVMPGIGRAVVPRNHPLLPQLLAQYPQIVEDTGGPERVYLCDVCDKEFGNPAAARMHRIAAHKSKLEKEQEEG